MDDEHVQTILLPENYSARYIILAAYDLDPAHEVFAINPINIPVLCNIYGAPDIQDITEKARAVNRAFNAEMRNKHKKSDDVNEGDERKELIN